MGGVATTLSRPAPRRLRQGLLPAMTAGAVAVLALLVAGVLPAMVGYDAFVVTGGSMSPAVRNGSILVSERVDPRMIEVGDVITFRRPQNPGLPVTHRGIGIEERDGVPTFLTKGDVNPNVDVEQVGVTLPISRMVYTVPYAGYVWHSAGRSRASCCSSAPRS